MPFEAKIPLCKCGQTLENHPYNINTDSNGLPKNWLKEHIGLRCSNANKNDGEHCYCYYIILKDGSAYVYRSPWTPYEIQYKTVKRRGKLIGVTMQNANQEE